MVVIGKTVITFPLRDFKITTQGAGKVETPSVAGRGQSKGGHQPTNLKEQLGVEEAMSNPGAGKTLEG